MSDSIFYLYEVVIGLVIKKDNKIIDKYKFKDTQEAIQYYFEDKQSETAKKFLKKYEKNTQRICDVINQQNIDAFRYKILSYEECCDIFELTLEEYGVNLRKFAFEIQNLKLKPNIIELFKVVDMLEKDINTRTMRVKEWYSLHFPELPFKSNIDYLNKIIYVKNRDDFVSEMNVKKKNENINSEDTLLLSLSEISMGRKFSSDEIENIVFDSTNILNDIKTKENLFAELSKLIETKMPNLFALMGNNTNDIMILCKLFIASNNLLPEMPAASIQVLGSKKAKSKHGIIFGSSYICRSKNGTGKIARMLANKISLCAKIDFECLENISPEHGIKFKKALDNKIEFLNARDSGKHAFKSKNNKTANKKTVEFVKKL
ncbi:nop56 [Ecytonucleospora hepatopenaei]|uniref:Nop56 n=1 Tax=Ecytonucleospora hepatopenaei TaxID=646526 RepID=A0A1W0E618_9MICR|nr:nop56 [Ecytonucleospora hepatopenaei]